MPLPVLNLGPAQGEYSAAFGNEIVAVNVQDGPSWRRRDFFGAPDMVDVQWVIDKSAYNYITAFFRTTIVRGTLPFTVDLIIADAVMAEYQAVFVPGTFRLAAIRGDAYFVTGTLEVKQAAVDEEYDQALVDIYEIYGAEAPLFLNYLAYFANTVLPDTLG